MIALKRPLTCIFLVSACLFVASHAMSAETRALIVAGLGGEAVYETEFQRQANTSADHLREVANDVTLLIGEAANRDAIRSALAEINKRATADDALVMLFIGHGSDDGEHFRFNVPGPDFTATDLAVWLLPVAASHIWKDVHWSGPEKSPN